LRTLDATDQALLDRTNPAELEDVALQALQALPVANCGRKTCSRNPFRRAGIVPSQSGKKITRWSARPITLWA
jgi:hypothetical protein